MRRQRQGQRLFKQLNVNYCNSFSVPVGWRPEYYNRVISEERHGLAVPAVYCFID